MYIYTHIKINMLYLRLYPEGTGWYDKSNNGLKNDCTCVVAEGEYSILN